MSRASETPPLGGYFEPSELTPLTALNLNNRDSLEPNNLYRYAGSVEEGAMGGDVDISSAGSPIFSSGTKAKQERRSSHGSNPSSGGENIEDFFSLIREELDKVNTFFVGKIAELKVNLDTIAQRRNNEDLRHHVTRSIDPRNMDELRSLYVELSAIRVYCSLNQTAFVKIIKKYDKTFSESNLGNWNNIIDKQPFTVSSEPVQLGSGHVDAAAAARFRVRVGAGRATRPRRRRAERRGARVELRARDRLPGRGRAQRARGEG